MAEQTQPLSPTGTETQAEAEAGDTELVADADRAQNLEPDVSADDAVGGHHVHTPAEHVAMTKAHPIHVWVAKYPLPCCCFMLWWFLLCGIICAVVPDLLNFSTDVPFYIRDNQATEEKDAWLAGRDEADWVRQTSQQGELQQQTAAEVDLKLLVKVNGDSTLMKSKYLEIIEELETLITETSGYEDHCRRLYPSTCPTCQGIDTDKGYKCARQASVLNFFDDLYFIPATDQNYTLYPTAIPNLRDYFAPSLLIDASVDLDNKDYSDEFVSEIVTYWAGYGNGEGPPGEYSPKYYDGEQMPAKFFYQLNGNNFSVSNVFASLSDKNFAYNSPLDTDVEVVFTSFSFGLPLEGYESSSDRIEDQQTDIGKWCYDELHEQLVDFAEKYEDDVTVLWECSDMVSYYSSSLLTSDALLMLATLVSVYLLMILNTDSVWLATNGMAMIFLNFLPAMLLYRYISQLAYFGTLNMMAMFIILAIGADDIFVICDTWAQYRTAAPDAPMDKRLTATLKHAGKVMATTSLSTCFSFIGNTTSQFPAVYTFGAFAAWLIFVNYCAVVLYFPTVLAVHDRYFFTPGLKKSCCITKKCAERPDCCTKCCGKYDNVREPSTEEEKRPIDVWFEGTLFPFISRQRKNIMVLSLLFFMAFFGLSTNLSPDPELPAFFPEDDNYAQFSDALSENFASETGLQMTNFVVWGIDGIDREDTDPTITTDIGTAVYSSNVSFWRADEQLSIAQFCDDLLCVYSDYSCRYPEETYYDLFISNPEDYGGERTNVVKCFMTEFRTWVQTDSAATPSESEIENQLVLYNLTETFTVADFADCAFDNTFPVEGGHCFYLLYLVIWLNEDLPTTSPDYVAGTSNYEYWKDRVRLQERDEDDTSANPLDSNFVLRFFDISVLTDIDISYDYNLGVELYDDWLAFAANWRDDVQGVTTRDRYGDEFVSTPDTLKSIMVTNGGFFSYFFIQKQIIREAYVGIGLSLLLAYIILTLATQNFLMALYSCATILAIVICVMGFTVANDWKLGVIEAVIYVMVVGMSVDYVVHLSEAYLASGEHKREDRARRMLGIVGGSVLSGAMSTILGIMWLLFATIVIFLKFGAFIVFLIACSLTFSLITFTAAMASFGPEGASGDTIICYKRCRSRCARQNDAGGSTETGTSHVEMR